MRTLFLMQTIVNHILLFGCCLFSTFTFAQVPKDGMRPVADEKNYKPTSRQNTTGFEDLYDKGMSYYKKDDAVNALYYFEKALALSSDNHKTLYMIAECKFKNKNYQGAIDYFNKAIFNMPIDLPSESKSSYYTERGFCRYLMGQYSEAKEDGQYALSESKKGDAYYLLGVSSYKLYSYDDAIDYLEKAESLSNSSTLSNLKKKVIEEKQRLEACMKKAEILAKNISAGDFSEVNILKTSFKAATTTYNGLLLLDDEGYGIFYVKYYDNSLKDYVLVSQFVGPETSDQKAYKLLFNCYFPMNVKKGKIQRTYRTDKLYVDDNNEMYNIDGQGEVVKVTCTQVKEYQIKEEFRVLGIGE